MSANVSEERLEVVYSIIAAVPAGVKADELASIHRGALRELERDGRIVYRNERWFAAEEPDRAARWHCESPFVGTDGREHKCEGRNEHNGPHYAWSVVNRTTVFANPDQHTTAAAAAEEKTMETTETESATRTNGKLKQQPPKKGQRVETIMRDCIEPDPNQPRKNFDEAKLNELAASIAVHGVEQPIVVRPNLDKHGSYIIVFGERRWRAAGIAGLEAVPSIIDTDAGDDPAVLLERQLIENAQREDIHPLEEGEALKALHEEHGHAIEELVAKVGKSRSHVYARIKLTELAPGVKKAMLEGRLPHAHGELIGRIPDQKLQEQCCKEVLGDAGVREIEDLGIHHESVNESAERYGRGKAEVLSFRATAALVRRRYQTRLSLATFDPTDATLTPAGSCGPCPHNSGNQPELPGVAAPVKAEAYCGNLPCFEKKTAAQFKRAADKARAEGKKVFEGKKAEALFYNNGQLKQESGYAIATQRLPYDVVHSWDDKLTYKKLLGKHLAEVPTAIVQDERGAPVEVLDSKKAIEVLREHKLLPKKGASASSGKSSAAEKRAKEKRKEEKAQEKLREEAYGQLITSAMAAAENLPASKETAMWRWVASAIATDYHYTERTMFAERRKLDYDTELEKLVEAAKTPGALKALVVEMMMCKMADSVVNEHGDADEAMGLATRLFGLDWKKAEKEALAAREVKKKTEAAEKAVAAKKKGGGK